MSKKHMGSSIDDFLKEEGIFEEAQETFGSSLFGPFLPAGRGCFLRGNSVRRRTVYE